MANGVNANLLRRWVVEQERKQTLVVRQPQGAAEAADKQAFLPIQFATHAVSEPEIRIELRRGATTVNVSWPSCASAACAAWLREILK